MGFEPLTSTIPIEVLLEAGQEQVQIVPII